MTDKLSSDFQSGMSNELKSLGFPFSLRPWRLYFVRQDLKDNRTYPPEWPHIFQSTITFRDLSVEQCPIATPECLRNIWDCKKIPSLRRLRKLWQKRWRHSGRFGCVKTFLLVRLVKFWNLSRENEFSPAEKTEFICGDGISENEGEKMGSVWWQLNELRGIKGCRAEWNENKSVTERRLKKLLKHTIILLFLLKVTVSFYGVMSKRFCRKE